MNRIIPRIYSFLFVLGFSSSLAFLCLFHNILALLKIKNLSFLTIKTMLRVIIAQDQEVRDAFLSVLSLERFTEEEGEFFVYKREKWILIFNEKKQIKDIVDWTLENYVPERLYLPFFGESIDIVHEVGDIILPNVFLTYDPHIQEAEIYKENRDKFLGSGHFLEIFNEQKDYYVEDYGLSV